MTLLEIIAFAIALATDAFGALASTAGTVPWDVVGVLVGLVTLRSISVAASGLWLERLPILHARRLTDSERIGVVNSGRGTALNILFMDADHRVIEHVDVLGPAGNVTLATAGLSQDVSEPAYMVYTDAFERWHHSKVVFDALSGRHGPILTRFYAGQWANLWHRASPLTWSAQRELARRSLSMLDYMRIATSWWRYRAWKWWLPGAFIRQTSNTLRWLYGKGDSKAFADSLELARWVDDPDGPSPAGVPAGLDVEVLSGLTGPYFCWHREYEVTKVWAAADDLGRVALVLRLRSFFSRHVMCAFLLERALVGQLLSNDEEGRRRYLRARITSYLNRRRPNDGEVGRAALVPWPKLLGGSRVRGAWSFPVELALGDGSVPTSSWMLRMLLTLFVLPLAGFVLGEGLVSVMRFVVR